MMMNKNNWVERLIQNIDDKDVEGFLSFLSEDVCFRFGNAEPVNGKATVGDVVGGFFESIKALHHDVSDIWQEEGAVICHGIVTYTRHDSSTLTVPFANIFKLDGDLIREYLIYIDVSELYKTA